MIMTGLYIHMYVNILASRSFMILSLIEQHTGTVLKLKVFVIVQVFLSRILHLIQQDTKTVLKLSTSALVTMYLTRISEASILAMYPWPIVVRQKAAYTSLGIVGRSFTY